MKSLKIEEHPVLNAYCLYVFHRYNEANNGSYGHIKAKGIMVKEIQVMEDYRSELHKECIRILKTLGFTSKETTHFLQEEIKKIVDKKLEPLQPDECYCGLCRIKIKKKDFDDHTETVIHKFIGEKVINLRRLWCMIKLDLMKDRFCRRREKNEER